MVIATYTSSSWGLLMFAAFSQVQYALQSKWQCGSDGAHFTWADPLVQFSVTVGACPHCAMKVKSIHK